MNLLLLEPGEVAPDGTARLGGRRLQHAAEVLRVAPGDSVRVGVRGGKVGAAEVLARGDTELVLRVALTEEPPPRPGLDLLLALPRPKALRRVLRAAASLGVDRLWLVNAARVERSFFSSPVLQAAKLSALLDEGLEQARDTRAPAVSVHARLRPFVEDDLPPLVANSARLVAHPDAAGRAPSPVAAGTRIALAIGPEGGWVPFELELLQRAGFLPVSLGPRILRVEVVVPYLLGALRR